MDVVKDIVRISVPFVAGVLAAACLNPGGYALSACSFAFSLCSLALCCRTGAGIIPFAVLFFALGVFCFSSASLAGPLHIDFPPLMDRVRKVIDDIGFADGRTAPLLKALLTGDKSCLDRETATSFRDSGASHILALSGLHLGIIYLITGRLLALSGNSHPARIFRSVISVSFCALYTVSTGASPSITRAFIFILLNELLKLDPGRKRVSVNIWCSAIMIQLCLDPSQIMSAGFQLSYLAMLGIFILFPPLDSMFEAGKGVNIFRKIWSAMALSVSCQTFTAPLVWIRFHTFPKYFILTNLLALPLTEGLIISGLAVLAFRATGSVPPLLISATDMFAAVLCDCLSVISSM